MMSQPSVTGPNDRKRTGFVEKLWIFDFDGTLSPIVPDRHAAEMDPSCRELVRDLVEMPGQKVAILSSRTLDDLMPRVGLSRVCLGGDSGLEWLYPGCNRRFYYGGAFEKDVLTNRKVLLPKLITLSKMPGVEIEYKLSSITVHVRHAPPAAKKTVANHLRKWGKTLDIRAIKVPEAYEIHYSPFADKALGVLILYQHLHLKSETHIVYAGDSDNDVRAMKSVLRLGGSAVTVGEAPLLPGSPQVRNPQELSAFCRKLARLEDL